MRSYGYAEATAKNYLSYATSFLHFLELNNVADITKLSITTIYEFVSALSEYSSVTVRGITGGVRVFLKYLYRTEQLEMDMSPYVGGVNRNRSLKLPSFWKKDEVLEMLSAVDRSNSNEKRAYAMLLLVIRLGLRSIDIKNFKLENLKWTTNTIEFTQSKTDKPISLPLLRDVGWAIIDYIQNARPQIDSPYLFLTHVAPYRKLSDGNHLYKTVEKYMQRAKIPISEKKKNGMHSLRHSLATTLLENETSIHTISDILGHTSSNSTSVYLQTDIERLRMCALNIDEEVL